MQKIASIPSATHMLHVLYLVHDVLQTEAARKDSHRPLIAAFKPCMPFILRPCYQKARATSGSGDECARVLRLLQLWVAVPWGSRRSFSWISKCCARPAGGDSAGGLALWRAPRTRTDCDFQVERNIISSQEAAEIKALAVAEHLPQGQPPGGMPGPPPGRLPLSRPTATVPGAFTDIPGMQRAGMPPIPPGRPGMMGLGGGRPPGLPYGSVGMQMAAMMRPQMVSPYQSSPRLFGYAKLPPLGQQKHTPETVPVGIMISMFQSARRQPHSKWVPYKPLDAAQTPQAYPMMVPSPQLMERVEDFYQDLRDEERSSSSSRSSSRSRSRSRSGSRSVRTNSRSRSPLHKSGGGGGDPGGASGPRGRAASPPRRARARCGAAG
ncbi:unnamed protein product, partial [Prorocentrum cordatum]